MTVAHHGIDDGVLVSKKQSRQRFRRSILEAWGWRCAYCEACLAQQATLDHVIPMSRGGPTSKGNLVAACASCNVAKSDQPLEAWYREQVFYSRRREWAIWWWRLTHGTLPLPPWGP